MFKSLGCFFLYIPFPSSKYVFSVVVCIYAIFFRQKEDDHLEMMSSSSAFIAWYTQQLRLLGTILQAVDDKSRMGIPC